MKILNSSAITDESLQRLYDTFIRGFEGLWGGVVNEFIVSPTTRRRGRKEPHVSALRRHYQGTIAIHLSVPSRAAFDDGWTPLSRLARPETGAVSPQLERAVSAVLHELGHKSDFFVTAPTCNYTGDVVPLTLKPKNGSVERSVVEKLESIGNSQRKLLFRRAEHAKRLAEYQQKIADIDAKLNRLAKRERKLKEKA